MDLFRIYEGFAPVDLAHHPPASPMRAFTLALALALPIGLAACADDATEEAYEEGAPAGDREDVIGDGEVFDEPGEPDAGVLGDGFTTYDADADGMLNTTEYGDGTNFNGVVMTDYDTDGDGMVSRAEYDAYMVANPMTMEGETEM